MAADEIALVQLRREIVQINDIICDHRLRADFGDRQVAEFQVRAVDRKLAVRFAVRHRDGAGKLQRPGDSVRRIFRPIIAQLNRA